MRSGFRHARHNRHLRATLTRTVGFFLFASAYWALLPLVTRTQIAAGPDLYGYLLGAIGASAVAGALALPWLNEKLGPDWLVAAGTVGTAAAAALFGLAEQAATALLASIIAGASWIAVISVLNVSPQLALPEWVRGRGDICDCIFWGAVSRQRDLGAGFQHGRVVQCALSGGSRRPRRHTPDVAISPRRCIGRLRCSFTTSNRTAVQ